MILKQEMKIAGITLQRVKNGATMYARIDDLPINEEIIDLYVTNRGGKNVTHR